MELKAEIGLCDLHLHIVPGIDDGARTMEASLEILRGLYGCGYRHFVATPHADDYRFTYSRQTIDDGFARLADAVAASDLPIDLAQGVEYTYGERLRQDVIARNAMTLADSRYVLLELPEEFMPATMPETLFGFGASGYYPVLAHPERCKPFQDDVDALVRLASGRALVQVSFRSLAGTFGRQIKKTAWRLVEQEIADLVATDCHSPREIRKVVEPVMKSLRRRLEPGHLNRLMSSFPRRMLTAI